MSLIGCVNVSFLFYVGQYQNDNMDGQWHANI